MAKARTVCIWDARGASKGDDIEWFQWLAERMKDREKSRSPVPAYIAHKEWEE